MPQSGTVPANLSSLWWAPEYPIDAESFGATLVSRNDGGEMVVPIMVEAVGEEGVLIRPLMSLLPGDYALIVQHACGIDKPPVEAVFKVVDESALPVSLGTLSLSEATMGVIELESGGGSCSDEWSAIFSDLSLAYSADALPWRDLLLYETVVDGRTWLPRKSMCIPFKSGSSWMGRGIDRIFVACEGDSLFRPPFSLEEGIHHVKMRGRLPGTDVVVETPEVEIEFECGTSTHEETSSGDSLSDVTSTSSENTSDSASSVTLQMTSSSASGEDAPGDAEDHQQSGCALIDSRSNVFAAMFGLALYVRRQQQKMRFCHNERQNQV